MNTQSLNRYHYAQNDPLNFVDINGLFRSGLEQYSGGNYINNGSAIIQETYNNLGMSLPVNDPFSWIQEMPKQQDVMTMNMSFNFGENSIDYGGGFNNLSVMYPQSYAEAQTFCESMEGIHIALDIVGAIDPTPISDAGNTILYLTCGKWTDAGLTILGIIPYFGDSFKSAKYADEVADAGKGLLKSSDEVGDIISDITKNYDNFECMECAGGIVTALKNKGINGEVLEIVTNGNKGQKGNIWSDLAGRNISTNGRHKSVLVDGIVYDNIHKNGISYAEWIKDIFSPTGYTIKTTSF